MAQFNPFENSYGGGSVKPDKSRYSIVRFVNATTGEVTFKLQETIGENESAYVGDIINFNGDEILVDYGDNVVALNTAIENIVDMTYNFKTFNELNIDTYGKTLVEITEELIALNLPTNTIVTGQLYTDALPFSGNAEGEVMINTPAYLWRCSSLNVAPYSWNAITASSVWGDNGLVMDWTPTYWTDEPLVFMGGITLTADNSDSTKCLITVSTPALAENIKKGYMYKVTSIASIPIYTGNLKIGDTFIADKNAPTINQNWILDTDWTVIPSGDETGYIMGKPTGTTLNNLIKWGSDGYTVEDTGVSIETNLDGTSDAKIPTSKSIKNNVTKTAIMTDYNKATSHSAISSTDTINQAIGKLEKGLENVSEKIIGISSTGTNYIELTNGVRVYFSDTEPTGTIPEDSIGIGF